MARYPVISGRDQARFLSQYSAVICKGTSPIVRFPGRDTVLFVISGRGIVTIADRQFKVDPKSAVCVKAGEAFQVKNDQGEVPQPLNLSVCPECASPEWLITAICTKKGSRYSMARDSCGPIAARLRCAPVIPSSCHSSRRIFFNARPRRECAWWVFFIHPDYRQSTIRFPKPRCVFSHQKRIS